MAQPIVTSDARLNAALVLLDSKGIWRWSYAPLLFRLLWRWGVKVPPPYMMGFWAMFCFGGLFWAVVGTFGYALWLLIGGRGMIGSPDIWVFDMLIAAPTCGLFMATFYGLARAIHGLPTWKRFTAS